ncbi:fasciclin domain-containing protein, partial [Streptomyces sp. NPDC097619]
MNSLRIRRTAIAVVTAALLPLTLTACSDSDGDTKAGASAAPGDEASTAASTPADDAMTGDQPFGAACAGVPKEGAGSFDGMAKDPVATAASNNPAL